jgi:hypothetical protein
LEPSTTDSSAQTVADLEAQQVLLMDVIQYNMHALQTLK